MAVPHRRLRLPRPYLVHLECLLPRLHHRPLRLPLVPGLRPHRPCLGSEAPHHHPHPPGLDPRPPLVRRRPRCWGLVWWAEAASCHTA